MDYLFVSSVHLYLTLYSLYIYIYIYMDKVLRMLADQQAADMESDRLSFRKNHTTRQQLHKYGHLSGHKKNVGRT